MICSDTSCNWLIFHVLMCLLLLLQSYGFSVHKPWFPVKMLSYTVYLYKFAYLYIYIGSSIPLQPMCGQRYRKWMDGYLQLKYFQGLKCHTLLFILLCIIPTLSKASRFSQQSLFFQFQPDLHNIFFWKSWWKGAFYAAGLYWLWLVYFWLYGLMIKEKPLL